MQKGEELTFTEVETESLAVVQAIAQAKASDWPCSGTVSLLSMSSIAGRIQIKARTRRKRERERGKQVGEGSSF